MNLDIDILINFFKKNTKSSSKNEFTEQDAPAAGGTSSGGGTTMPVWADIVGGPARGKANQIKDDTKWESGAKRGVSNQIW